MTFWPRITTDSGINRNIVECKGYMAAMLKGSQERINRNIVECKESCR